MILGSGGKAPLDRATGGNVEFSVCGAALIQNKN
jgi:hypothetical protein